MLFLYYDILLHSINHVSMMLGSVQLILQHNIPTDSESVVGAKWLHCGLALYSRLFTPLYRASFDYAF